MQLHANAALSLNQRRRMCRRVVEEGWSLTKAAEAAEVSDRTRSSGSRATGPRASSVCSIARRRRRSPTARAADRVEAIAALRRLRMTGQEIAECLGMALSTVSGVLARIGLGKLARLGARAGQPLRARRPGELVHIDIKKLGRIVAAPGTRHRPRAAAAPPTRDGGGAAAAGSSSTRHRRRTRLAYAEVLADEKATTAVGVPAPRARLLRRHGITVERLLTDNGSAYRATATRSPAATWASAPAHPPLPAADQRQGRALHPDPARRMGLRPALPQQRRAHRTLTAGSDHYNHTADTAASATSHPIARLNELANPPALSA